MTAFKKNRPFTGGFGRRRPQSYARDQDRHGRRGSDILTTYNNTRETNEEYSEQDDEENQILPQELTQKRSRTADKVCLYR